MCQGVKELREGLHDKPGTWLFQPGKLSPREAGVGMGSVLSWPVGCVAPDRKWEEQSS